MAGNIQIEAVILSGQRMGCDFVSRDQQGEEHFSARLMDNSKTLEITWVERLSQLLLGLREIQHLAGGPGSITTMRGMASAKLENDLRGGKRVDLARVSRLLGKILGGNWKVEITPRSRGKPAIFDIQAVLQEV